MKLRRFVPRTVPRSQDALGDVPTRDVLAAELFLGMVSEYDVTTEDTAREAAESAFIAATVFHEVLDAVQAEQERRTMLRSVPEPVEEDRV